MAIELIWRVENYFGNERLKPVNRFIFISIVRVFSAVFIHGNNSQEKAGLWGTAEAESWNILFDIQYNVNWAPVMLVVSWTIVKQQV